jgi:hypothetical protein
MGLSLQELARSFIDPVIVIVPRYSSVPCRAAMRYRSASQVRVNLLKY